MKDNSLFNTITLLSLSLAAGDVAEQMPRQTKPEPVPLTPEQQRIVDGFRARRARNKAKGKV